MVTTASHQPPPRTPRRSVLALPGEGTLGVGTGGGGTAAPPAHGHQPRAGTGAAQADAHGLAAPPSEFPDPTCFPEPSPAAPCVVPAASREGGKTPCPPPRHPQSPGAGWVPSPRAPTTFPLLPQPPSRGESSDACYFCGRRVYILERASAEGRFFHRGCFQCWQCGATLRLGDYAFHEEDGEQGLGMGCWGRGTGDGWLSALQSLRSLVTRSCPRSRSFLLLASRPQRPRYGYAPQ